MSAVSHSLHLARLDISRMLRKYANWRDGSSAVVSALVYGVVLIGTTLGGGYFGYRAGQSLAAGEFPLEVGSLTVIEIVRGLLAVYWLVITLVFIVRAVGQRGTLSQPEGILTVVPTSQALLGVLFAEYAYFLLWVLVPAVSIGAGLALGTGVVWTALTVPLAVAATGIGSVGIGYLVGITIRHIATRFEFIARNKTAIVATIFVTYIVAISTGVVTELVVQLFEPLQQLPIGWYADLLSIGTPQLAASPLYAGGAIVLTLVLAALAIVGGTRVADRHWFSDPVLAGVTEPTITEGDRKSGIERWLEPTLGSATASLIALSWRRAYRAPLKLLYAFYPLILGVGFFAEILQTGQVPASLPYVVLLFAAWAAGVIFTLNPLGDQGAVLASTLLSGVNGRVFVRAHVLAGLLVGVPLGMVATAAIGVLSPLDEETVLMLVAVVPLVMIIAAALSIGIGMAFPRFEATNITRSMKTVVPSLWAFVLFSLHLFATAGAATIAYEPFVRELAAGIVSWLLPFGLSMATETLYVVSVVVLMPLVLAPLVSYWYAVRRFDRYTLA